MRAGFIAGVRQAVDSVDRVRDVQSAVEALGLTKNTQSAVITLLDLGTGRALIELTAPRALFYTVISEMIGAEVEGDSDVMRMMRGLTHAKREYDKVATALDHVRSKGYGIVMPFLDEIAFEEPDIIRQGSRCGVRLKATAPSIHMIRADIKTEVTPLVGTEKQSEEFARRMAEEFAEDPSKIWQTESLNPDAGLDQGGNRGETGSHARPRPGEAAGNAAEDCERGKRWADLHHTVAWAPDSLRLK